MSKVSDKVSIAQELNGTHEESKLEFVTTKYEQLRHYWYKRAGQFEKEKLMSFVIEGKIECLNEMYIDKSSLTELELRILETIREHNRYYKVVFYNKIHGFWFLGYHGHFINVQILSNNRVERTNHPTLYVIDSDKFEDALVKGFSYANFCLKNEINCGLTHLFASLF